MIMRREKFGKLIEENWPQESILLWQQRLICENSKCRVRILTEMLFLGALESAERVPG